MMSFICRPTRHGHRHVEEHAFDRCFVSTPAVRFLFAIAGIARELLASALALPTYRAETLRPIKTFSTLVPRMERSEIRGLDSGNVAPDRGLKPRAIGLDDQLDP